jgi:hypothetical protein
MKSKLSTLRKLGNMVQVKSIQDLTLRFIKVGFASCELVECWRMASGWPMARRPAETRARAAQHSARKHVLRQH